MSISASRRHGSPQWVCRACAASIRGFSMTAGRSTIPPESPRYIEVPQPLQQWVKTKKVVKGKLPVPKDVFGGSRADHVSPTWFDKTTLEPQDRSIPDGPEAPRLLWKQRMADKRRQNLREGVLELHTRKRREQRTARVVQQAKKEDLHRRVSAPERSDERLTRPSINEVLRDIFKKNDHTWTGKPIAERRANYAAQQSAKSEARQDAIHSLYMHARHFITTEQQLDNAVEKAFTKEDGTPITDSVWSDSDRRPQTTQEMLAQGAGSRGGDDSDKRASQRMKRIAEELTGGKIGDEWRRTGLR